jgi:hypothetical protein
MTGAALTNDEVARKISRATGEDAVVDIAGVGKTPYDWVLIRPDGSMFEASESPDNDDDRFELDESPAKMRSVSRAAEKGFVPDRIEYVTGSEHGIQPFGELRLEIAPDGAASLEHRFHGHRNAWRGQVQIESIRSLFDALAAATFPTQVAWASMAPDEEMRSLTIGSDPKRKVVIPWNQARKTAGYADAFRILDEIVRQLSDGKVAIGRASSTIHVVNAREIS